MSPVDLIRSEKNTKELRLIQAKAFLLNEFNLLKLRVEELAADQKSDLTGISELIFKLEGHLSKCQQSKAQVDALETLLLRFD